MSPLVFLEKILAPGIPETAQKHENQKQRGREFFHPFLLLHQINPPSSRKISGIKTIATKKIVLACPGVKAAV